MSCDWTESSLDLVQRLGSSAVSDEAQARQILGSAKHQKGGFFPHLQPPKNPLQPWPMSFTAKCNREHGGVGGGRVRRGRSGARLADKVKV